jgi:hypothetical protein
MKRGYTGGCQCGAVRYAVQAEIDKVVSCNCSRCQKLGALLAAAEGADFNLLQGGEAMTDFQFNKHHIHHPFCKTCGIESYAYGKGKDGRDMVMLNVRCLDGVDPDQFEVMKFDGRSL